MADQRTGFRFYPTEEELVSFYLRNKLEGNRQQDLHLVIPVIDIYQVDPWQLPKLSGERCQGDTEQWFFFTPRQEREARGGRTNRSTVSGYWKATGSPSYVFSSNYRVIGMKKTMVFYEGKAPTGRKTKWKMNEYRAIEAVPNPANGPAYVPKLRHEFSLCRVYVVSGSLRAFDRRPLEAVFQGTQLPGAGAGTSSQSAAVVMERPTSSGTSRSEGGKSDLPETSGVDVWKMDDNTILPQTSGSNIWGMVGDLEQQQLWEWGHLTWP